MGLSLPPFMSRPLRAASEAAPPEALDALRGAHLLISGATGFFGVWTLSAIAKLNDERHLGIRALCLSRDPNAFLARHPELAARAELAWLQLPPGGWPEPGKLAGFTHILHMAASANARDYARRPMASFIEILDGARFAIEAAKASGAHLHFVSSGAVYGARRQSDGPCEEGQIERFAPHPLDPSQPYANAKRSAEALIACSGAHHSISRPFAFLGPHLPLDRHFAAGNFILDALHRRPIAISGDGSPIRSYMHPADLALWTLSLCGIARPGLAVNVGSDEPLALKTLAELVSRQAGSPAPIIALASAPSNPSAYWPSVQLARSLGLRLSLSARECVDDALACGAML